MEGTKSRAGERRTAEPCKSASVCSCCKSSLPKYPLCWSEHVKVPFSCENVLFHKFFTKLFLTPGGNTKIVGIFFAQLLLQFYADPFETLQVFLSWSGDVHVVWIIFVTFSAF